MHTVVRFVDDWRNPNPGSVHGNKLILIGKQIERRIFRKGTTKYFIFQEAGTRNIWYKPSMHSVGVVAMGFSLSRLKLHPKAVSMEDYARYFIDEVDPAWLERNDFILAKERICRAVISNGKINFESAIASGSTLEEIIEDDKRYGTMKPHNGKYFTYRVMDWEGKWISNEQITRGITTVWNKVEKILDLEFREATPFEYADFKVYFRRTADDPLLDENTLQYHFYPIEDFDNPNRGVCVVNIDWPYTVDGEGIPLHLYDPVHYPEPTTAEADTIDFDAVYEHEGPGHGLGLPHSPNRDTKMFGNYSGMIESIFDEDPPETIQRWLAKYQKRIFKKPHHLKRWIKWFKAVRDRQ